MRPDASIGTSKREHTGYQVFTAKYAPATVAKYAESKIIYRRGNPVDTQWRACTKKVTLIYWSS